MGATVAPCSNSAPPNQRYLVGTQQAPALHRSPLQGYVQALMAHTDMHGMAAAIQPMICG